jgi:two-component system response regulator
MTAQSKRIALIVEGIQAVEKLILDAFIQTDFVCNTVVIRDGEQALDYLLRRGAYAERDTHVMPCITLLDLSLQGLEGLEVLREIRANGKTRLLPIVAFSSSSDQQDVKSSYEGGANSYISKAPESESFVGSIKQVAYYWCILNEPPPTP